MTCYEFYVCPGAGKLYSSLGPRVDGVPCVGPSAGQRIKEYAYGRTWGCPNVKWCLVPAYMKEKEFSTRVSGNGESSG